MINKIKKKLNKDLDLKELLTGSLVSFILKMSGMFAAYIVILIISKQYGAEIVGIYNLTFNLLTFIAMICMLGINISILRYVGQYKDKEDFKLKKIYQNGIKLVLPVSIIFSFLIYINAEFIATKVFDNILYIDVLKYMSFFLPLLTILNINIEYIRGLKQIKISEYLRNVNQPLIVILFILISSQFISNEILPIYILGLAIFITSVISIIIMYKYISKVKNEADYNTNLTNKELLNTSIPMMFTTLSIFLISNSGLFILEYYSTTKDVGIYSVILKISMLVSIVLIVVNTISAPKFSKLYWSGNKKQLQEVINKSTKIIFLVSLLISLILLIFSERILGYFGNDFSIGSDILSILILGQLINSFTGSVNILMNMIGKQKKLQQITLLILIINIILSLLLIPSYGMIGAAISTMISVSLLNVIPMIYLKKYLDFTTYFKLTKD